MTLGTLMRFNPLTRLLSSYMRIMLYVLSVYCTMYYANPTLSDNNVPVSYRSSGCAAGASC
jgi:hypothetical protein